MVIVSAPSPVAAVRSDPAAPAHAHSKHQQFTRGPWQLDTSSSQATASTTTLPSHKDAAFQAEHPPSSSSTSSSPTSSPPLVSFALESPASAASTSMSSPPRTASSPDAPSPYHNGAHLPFTPPDLAPQQISTLIPKISEDTAEAGQLPTPLTDPIGTRRLPSVGLARSGAIKSRNDIFAPSPVLTPPRPPPSAAISSPSQNGQRSRNTSFFATADSPASTSRNSLFFNGSCTPAADNDHTSPPASATSLEGWRGQWGSHRDAPLALGANEDIVPYSAEVTRANSYGRSNEEERARERIRIRQSKEIDFRLAPSKDFILGEGRHCTVFLGAYRRRIKARSHRTSDATGEEAVVGDWQLCAIKRLHADRESQLLGLDEAFALRRLGSHPGIIKLIDIRDEVLAETSPLPTPRPGTAPQQHEDGGFGVADGQVPDERALLGHGPPPKTSAASSNHGRSTSSAMTMESTGDQARIPPSSRAALSSSAMQKHQRSAHSRIASQPTSSELNLMPTPRAYAPGVDRLDEGDSIDDDDVPISAAAMHSRSATDRGEPQHASQMSQHSQHLLDPSSAANADPPRLLILLELLPFTLSTYVKRNADAVDLGFWLHTGIAIAEALEFIHTKGCIHSDIKPENILLDRNHRPKLCDFNSAIFLHAASAPQIADGLGLGTPGYSAPELTKRGHGKQLSYAVDIFSLGAVLYSLATGVEPMSRARSMIDMLHRKERWFLSEENDRIARHSIEWGGSSSNAGSTCASRHGSMRGKRDARSQQQQQQQQQYASILPDSSGCSQLLRRTGSADSLESHASSITNTEGKTPSLDAIELLLQSSDVVGVMLPPVEQRLRASSLRRAGREKKSGQDVSRQHELHEQQGKNSGHHRASSLHKQLGPSSSLRASAMTVSFKVNGEVEAEGSGERGSGQTSAASRPADAPSINLPSDSQSSSPSRPAVLRRTTSYGNPPASDSNDVDIADTGVAAQGREESASSTWRNLYRGPADANLLSPPQSPHVTRTAMPRVRTTSANATTTDPAASADSHVNLALAATFANAARKNGWKSGHRRGHSASSLSSCFSHDEEGSVSDGDGEDGGEESSTPAGTAADITEPYSDGSPALILPSGTDRLPQAALNLIESMVHANPLKRPRASEVRDRLLKIARDLGH